MFKLVVLVLTLMLPVQAFAKDGSEGLLNIIVIAKMTGACGIFHQMVSFQETTKMPGGDQFIRRFVTTETTRLGLTVKEYFELCSKSTKVYNDLYEKLQ